MAVKIVKKDAVWGYAGQLLYSGMNILILPFVVRQLPMNELGLWYTFTTIGALATLLDFGFRTTITRNIAYAWSGAKEIPKSGDAFNVDNNEPNLFLLQSVIKVSRIIYLIVGVVALTLLATVGTYYIFSVTNGELAIRDFLPAWIIYILAIFLNIYFGYWSPTLKGIGAIKENYQAEVITKGIQLIVAIIGLVVGWKLLAISIAFLLSSILMMIISRTMFYKYEDVKIVKERLTSIRVSLVQTKNTFLAIWPNAYKQGFMSFSNYLVEKSAILITSSVFGLAISASLGLTMQIFSVVAMLSNVLFNTYMPYIIQLRISTQESKAMKIFKQSLGVQSLIILIGGLVLMIIANPILILIGSNSTILPMSQCLVILLFVWIHNFQQVCCSYIIAGNKVPMYRAYLITGIITIFTGILLSVAFGKWVGIWTIILSQLIVLLSYNGWKWADYIAKENGLNFLDLYIQSFKSVVRIKKSL